MSEEEKAAAKIKREEKKIVDNKLKEEQRLSSVLNQHLERLLKFPESHPPYSFEIGEQVSYKSNQSFIMTIVEKYNDYIFKVKKENGHDYVHISEIIKNGIQKDTSFSKKDTLYNMISFHNSEISALLHYYYYFNINLNPSYQRPSVWSDKNKEFLLDSIFSNIEIGKFALIQNNDYSLEILDGKQRLETIIEFYEDRLKYKGYLFSELSVRDRSHFLSYSVTIGKNETFKEFTEKDKINYFIRLNTSGVAQDNDHLEKLRKRLEEI